MIRGSAEIHHRSRERSRDRSLLRDGTALCDGPPGFPPLQREAVDSSEERRFLRTDRAETAGIEAFRGGAVTRDSRFFHHEGDGAFRVGDFKRASAGEDGDAWELFDPAADRCEQHDLAVRQPDRVREMTSRWQEMRAAFCGGPGKLDR